MEDISHRWIRRNPSAKAPGKAVKGYSPVFLKLLYSRGLESRESIEDFLNPSLKDLHDPLMIPGMKAAVSRIIRAVKTGEKVWIFGDYDADGIISAALLYNFLCRLGPAPQVYIPDRVSEGYDLNQDFLESVTGKADLVVCVDCGTNSSGPREYVMAHDDCPEVIACDHHNPTMKSYDDPGRYIVVNPRLPGTSYPFRDLSGAGVTFKFIMAVLRALDAEKKKDFSSDYLNSLLDLVAISTLADLMPLKDENRILVKKGLERMKKTSNPGLRDLMEVSLTDSSGIDEYGVGFVLAPRLNAAGRVKDAMDSFRLLCLDSRNSRSIAGKLDKYNTERQKIQKEVLEEIMDDHSLREKKKREKIFIKHSDSWDEGILGIVASDIVKVLNIPVILFRERDGVLKGSGRSISEFSLHRNLERLKDLFQRFGGHDLACGITMESKNFDIFRRKMSEIAESTLSEEDLVKKYRYDIEIDLDEIDDSLVRDIGRLRPFGRENPAPLFVTYGCSIQKVKKLKDGLHAKLFLKKGGMIREGIMFNLEEDKHALLAAGDPVNILYSLDFNCWMGKRTIQLNIRDLF